MSLRFTESKSELESKKIWKVPTIIGFDEKSSETSNTQIVCIIDTETTGLDTNKDEIIELGYMLIEYDQHGRFFDVIKRFNQLQQPSVPITPEITKITGITDEDLEGKSIDWNEVVSDISTASLLVAHNAQFDRKMLERYSDVFKDRIWGCSVNDVDWESIGEKIRSQEWLLYKIANCYYEAHRALDDVNALSFLLSRPHPEYNTPLFQQLSTNAVQDSYIIRAVGSAFSEKDSLKALGCRWDGDNRIWWMKASESNLSERQNAIQEAAPTCRPQVSVIHAKDRYSVRDV